MDAAISALEDRLGYRFADVELLRQALRHRSWCAEHPGHESNERLEFLGDAVLGWVVADVVYRRDLVSQEGKLSDLRKGVVNAAALAEEARDLDIGSCLYLGRGTSREAREGGRSRTSVLADALEAIIAAIYLDGGPDAAYRFVERRFAGRLDRSDDMQLDAKFSLKDLARRNLAAEPVYEITEEGPAHAKNFTAVVRILDETLGAGSGPSRKEAERRAASMALAILRERESTLSPDAPSQADG